LISCDSYLQQKSNNYRVKPCEIKPLPAESSLVQNELQLDLPKLLEAPEYSETWHIPTVIPERVPVSKMPQLVPLCAMPKLIPLSNLIQKKRNIKSPECVSLKEVERKTNLSIEHEETKPVRQLRRFKRPVREQDYLLKQQEMLREWGEKRSHMASEGRTFNEIANIAYAFHNSQATFKCTSIHCTFIGTNVTVFENHLKTKHRYDSWLKSHEFCKTCKARTGAASLTEEFEHMITTHIERENSLEGLIEILEGADVINESGLDDKDDEARNVIPAPQAIEDGTDNEVHDDIELKIMELLADKKRAKIDVSSVETLPNFDLQLSKDEEIRLFICEWFFECQPKVFIISKDCPIHDIESIANEENLNRVDELPDVQKVAQELKPESVNQKVCEPSCSKVHDQNAIVELVPSTSMSYRRQSTEHRFKFYQASDLMPWMDSKLLRQNQKSEICYREMLSELSIRALFKCMSSRCSFTTNDEELFLNHLI
jgi:hypothetical protein